MSGNIMEWCNGPDGTFTPRLRGGSVDHLIGFCNVAARGSNPVIRLNVIGFRLARSSR